jgi:nucleotide-binding universal stress UspA family protein
MYNKILVAVDGSDNALRAAAEAVRMARGNPDAQLALITVVPLVDPVFGFGPLLTTQQVADAERAAANEVLKKAEETVAQAKQAVEMTEQSGIKVESFVQIGDPAQAIAEHAAKGGYEVIVMGRRGMGIIRELLLGSVSSKVLQLTTCPVLLVR